MRGGIEVDGKEDNIVQLLIDEMISSQFVSIWCAVILQISPTVKTVSAFVNPSTSTSRYTHHIHQLPIVALHASKSAAKNKKKNKSSNKQTGGGFGAAPTSSRKGSKKDTIKYPELEDKVLQTLVPSSSSVCSTLSEEMYDRLEEIYGLAKFNFGGENAIYKSIGTVDSSTSSSSDRDIIAESSEGSLFDDILSSGGSSSSQSSNALDDLLSPSTLSTPAISLDDLLPGDNAQEKSSTQESQSSNSFDLNNIPPFEKFRVLHTDPMVLAIDDFFSEEECDKYVQISLDAEESDEQSSLTNLQPMLLGKSQTVGKDSRSQAQRTSTTWFHYFEGVPELMAKASRLLGLEGIDRWEEPQTVRYRRNEKFTWHLDALSPDEATNESGAGQRVATLLVYLTDLTEKEGGATMFRDLGGDNGPLKVRPKKGSALLFFPAAGGIPTAPFDIRTLHCGEAVSEDAESEKWISQLWLRQRQYKPTAPAGNTHVKAFDAIDKYCS